MFHGVWGNFRIIVMLPQNAYIIYIKLFNGLDEIAVELGCEKIKLLIC